MSNVPVNWPVDWLFAPSLPTPVCRRGGILVPDQEAGPRQAAGQPERLPAALYPQRHLPARARQTHARSEGLHREEDVILQEGYSVPATWAAHMEDVGHEGRGFIVVVLMACCGWPMTMCGFTFKFLLRVCYWFQCSYALPTCCLSIMKFAAAPVLLAKSRQDFRNSDSGFVQNCRLWPAPNPILTPHFRSP